MLKAILSLYRKDRLALLASANALRAIREGLLWTLPCLLVSALFLVLSVLARQAGLPEPATELLTSVHQKLTGIMPMLVAAAIGYMLSIRHRVPHLPTAFLCLSYVAVAETLLAAHPLAASTLTLFVAIISPLAAVPLLSWLHRLRWTARADGLTGDVRETLNMVVPGILTAAVLIGALSALLSIPGVAQFSIPVSLTSLQNPMPPAR